MYVFPWKVTIRLSKNAVQAQNSILQWKAHILRAANQDRAKTDAVKSLQCDTILVVMDWAMKFTHMKYREKQSEWFGKRGMNWHISYQNERPKNSLMLLLMCISLTAVPRTPAQFLLYSYNSWRCWKSPTLSSAKPYCVLTGLDAIIVTTWLLL